MDVDLPNPFQKPDDSDEKNDTSPSDQKPSTPPPATARSPAKSNTPKSPPPSDPPSQPSPDTPAKKSPDVANVPLPAVWPPPWSPKSEQPNNNNNVNTNNNGNNVNTNNNDNDNNKNAPSSWSSASTVTPTTSGRDKKSPPSDQFSLPAQYSASPDTKQPNNNNNPPGVSGSSTNPLPSTPQTAGADSDPPSSSGGSNGTPSPPSSTQSPGASQSAMWPHPGIVVGLTLAVVCIVALIALLIVCAVRKKKKRPQSPKYVPSPNHNPTVNSHGYHNVGGSPKQPSGSNVSISSHGSKRLNGGGGRPAESPAVMGGVTFFSYEDLMEITNGFARQNVIGEGGFGCVFKGSLPGGRPVAVKQLKVGARQGEKEFRAEVDIISRIHHRHLVSLVGYCISDKERLLIYEFVPNNTLEHHLHGTPVLDWAKRVKIALGAAKGLAYLHEDCSPKIIHRDIKSANILLQDSFEAKVADFGLAKIASDSNTHVSTRVMGTFGYMAPEYANSGKLTDRSDVFSFGVVLLELVTGRKPVDPTQPLGEESLVEWARPLLLHTIETGDCRELVDPRLEKHYEESTMITMIEAAAACIRHSAPKRPRMVQVMRALDTADDMTDLSNGLKYGESTVYDSGQYDQDIMNFRMSRFDSGTDESFDQSFGAASSAEFSGESELRALSSSFGRQQRSYSRSGQFK